MNTRRGEHHHEYDPHLWLSHMFAMNQKVKSLEFLNQLVAAYPDKKRRLRKMLKP